MNAEERYARAEARAVARVKIGNTSPRRAARLIEEECVKEIRAAVLAEREACAKVCVEIAREAKAVHDLSGYPLSCAERIRLRGAP